MGKVFDSDCLSRTRLVALRAWAAVGCALVCVLAVAAANLIRPAVELVLVGSIVGFVCSPLTNRLEDAGLSRAFAAFLSLAAVIGLGAIVVILLVPPFINQLVEALRQIPSLTHQLQEDLTRFWDTFGNTHTTDVQASMSQLLGALSSFGIKSSSDLVEKLSSGLVQNVMSTFNGMVTLFLAAVMGYWLAKDYPVIMRELGIIAGPAHEHSLSVTLAVLSRSVGGYMRGVAITSLVCGLLCLAGFLLIGHPYAALVAILAAVLHLVPVIGPWLAAVAAVLLALFVSPLLAFEALVVSVIATNVTDNVISPIVMQTSVSVHPALSLFGIMVGSALGGIGGMVLAIPLTAALRGLFVYYFEEHTHRQLVAEDGALFRGNAFVDDGGQPQSALDALGDSEAMRRTKLIREVCEQTSDEDDQNPHIDAHNGEKKSDSSIVL